MKVLVIGAGGREHALAWRLARSPRVQQVFVAPGNGGTACSPVLKNVPITDLTELRNWALAEGIALTVVGPEQPLAAGVVDDFRAHGLRIFGPTRAAAQLESSKAFSKDFMRRHGIPTAEYATFSDAAQARDYVAQRGAPIVVKADGLAAGKGVVVAQTVEEAYAAIDDMLGGNSLGVAHNEGGARVVIEECLRGEEASFIVLSDGRDVLALATSQDHKRLLDGDAGPNTGGMGAYSPAPVVTDAMLPGIKEKIILPVVRELKKRGITYKGVLYAGLMITPPGGKKALSGSAVNVVEFNARFGDPETEAVLPRLGGDFSAALMACVDGTLSDDLVTVKPESAATVIMASGGYPGSYEKGQEITGLADANAVPGATVFHCGTKSDGGKVLTSGGRVLSVTGLGADLRSAVDTAYAAVGKIAFEGEFHRKDIAHRAFNR